MNDFLQTIIESLSIMTMYEAIARVLAIAYILLAIRQNIWCWPAAFLSTLIYAVLFFEVSLLMDSMLNLYYLVMAIYGWYSWKYGSNIKNEDLKVNTYGLLTNIKIIVVLSFVSLCFGYIMANYTSADFAYIDSFTTVFAVKKLYSLLLLL